MLWLVNENDGGGVVRPKVSYDFRDNFTVSLGMDIFYGSRDGLFGQFKDNNRVDMSVEIGL